MSDYRLTTSDAVVRVSDGAVIPNDPDNRDRAEYTVWLTAGGTPDPYVPPVPPPVAQVTMLQARLALAGAGLLTSVNSTVAAADQSTQLTWEYATMVSRSDPLVATLSSALGLTSSQVDALFATAATLTAS